SRASSLGERKRLPREQMGADGPDPCIACRASQLRYQGISRDRGRYAYTVPARTLPGYRCGTVAGPGQCGPRREVRAHSAARDGHSGGHGAAHEGDLMALTGAVFLDKDGTLLEDVPYNVEPEKMRPAAGV